MVNTAMIRALMQREKMTQEQLGDLLGVSRQWVTWALLENKRNDVKVSHLAAIADYFGVAVDDMIIKNISAVKAATPKEPVQEPA